ncbi:cytochrome P450 [Pseudomonas fluorescens]|nr:cytochrome P450 [Pseudomonas fluorescens]
MELPRLRDFDDANFNPFVEETMAYGDVDDPYPRYAELREKGRVLPGDFRVTMGLYPDITHPTDAPHFLVTGYDESIQVLTNPTVFSNKAYTFNLGAAFGRSVSTMDAPEHTRYRRIFQKIFLPQNIQTWGETIVDPVVSELMEEFIGTGKADLVQQFTLHYPFRVVYRQLALPSNEAKLFHKLAIAQTLISADREHAVEASEKLGEYFPKLIAIRRENPGDDLISLLANTEVDGEYLPEDVLVSFLRQLINAGGDTTYRGTSVLLTRLLENPDQLEEIRQDRSLIPNAIDEALRIDGPVIMQDRWALTDTEVGGVKIPAGSIVHVCAGAANRDPKHFPDPDRFDIRRANAKRHIAFSTGPHVCIGQHLARIEMTRALTTVLDRLPNLRLDPDMPKPRVQGVWMRVPHHIHVRFDPQPN